MGINNAVFWDDLSIIVSRIETFRMDILDEPIEAERYQVNSDSFEVVDRESDPYVNIAPLLEEKIEERAPTKFCLQDSDAQRKTRIVYTIGLDLSESSDWTVPIFEISLPSSDRFQGTQQYRSERDDELSAYTNHLRSLFIEEDQYDRLTGLGPIGKCLSLSQERNVILYLKGIDRVPGRAQSMFFGILERRPKIQYGVEIAGDPENLTICSTTGETSNPEDLDRKLRSILGTAHRVDTDSSDR